MPARIDKARRVSAPPAGDSLPQDSIRVALPESLASLLDAPAAPPRDDADPISASAPAPVRLPRAGRMLLLMRAVDSDARGTPLDAPFFQDPQPLGSFAVAELVPGTELAFDGQAIWWPGPPEWLNGAYEVQAVFDRSETERGHAAPDNLISAPVRVEFDQGRADAVTLSLDRRIEAQQLPELPNVTWYEMRSPMLSKAMGHDVAHRAAVVVPREYGNVRAPRRFWPTVYVIPGFGGRWTDAVAIADLLARPEMREVLPQAVHVVLDPESAYGHHGFVDSAANGPRGRALVEELIPALERRFRLVREPAARVLTGHSSGGWTALWLLVKHPSTFGAAFASAPDPVDFSAFQAVDLYRDTNLFADAAGVPFPSMRIPMGPGHDLVPMTVRDEVGMERALSPRGASGEQWDSWAAMWSPIDDRTGAPRRLANPVTGEIDPVTVEAWSAFDLARLARSDEAVSDALARRAHIICGDRDSFYLDRAVAKLHDLLLLHDRSGSFGLIELLPDLDHGTVAAVANARFQRAIGDYLEAHALTGPDRPDQIPPEMAGALDAPPAQVDGGSAEPAPSEPAPAAPAPPEPAPATP